MVAHTFNPTSRKQRQADLRVMEASQHSKFVPGHLVLQRDPVSKGPCLLRKTFPLYPDQVIVDPTNLSLTLPKAILYSYQFFFGDDPSFWFKNQPTFITDKPWRLGWSVYFEGQGLYLRKQGRGTWPLGPCFKSWLDHHHDQMSTSSQSASSWRRSHTTMKAQKSWQQSSKIFLPRCLFVSPWMNGWHGTESVQLSPATMLYPQGPSQASASSTTACSFAQVPARGTTQKCRTELEANGLLGRGKEGPECAPCG